jgi:acetyl esterase/lipase
LFEANISTFDSAGGNLSLALLQTILEIRRQNLTIKWFGQEREVPLPAGVALNSPWVDITQSMPSCTANLKWDYLPPPLLVEPRETPADGIWPASPPRKHIFIDDAYMLHPLASLQLSASWEGSPPVYICTGWESLADEDKYIARKLTRDGVTVVFEEYEAMPHCFAMILGPNAGAKRCFEGWTKFITAAVENPKTIASSYKTIRARTLEEVEIDAEQLSPFAEEDVRRMAYNRIEHEPSMPETLAKL